MSTEDIFIPDVPDNRLPDSRLPGEIAKSGIGEVFQVWFHDRNGKRKTVQAVVVCAQADGLVHFEPTKNYSDTLKEIKYEAGLIGVNNELYPAEERWLTKHQGRRVYQWGGNIYSITR